MVKADLGWDGPITVRSLLDLDEVRFGRPAIVNGEASLDRPVRWVHVADSEGVGALIEGGELVLSTAAGFRGSRVRVRRFLEDLERGGAAATFIELVDKQGAPDEQAVAVLVEAAAGLALPVVVVRRRIKFVRVTQAAHRLLIGEQLARLEQSRRVHEVFTQLNLESADEQRIVDTTARLLGSTVVLEDVAHRVLLLAGGDGGKDGLLAGWSARGCEDAQVPVGAGGRVWGRLVAPGVGTDDAQVTQVLERAGQALTLARMAARDEEDLLHRARAGFLQALIAADLTEEEARARARALGLSDAKAYVPVAVRMSPQPGEDLTDLQLRERVLMEEFLAAARPLVGSVITAGLRTGSFALLVGLQRQGDVDGVLTRVVQKVKKGLEQQLRSGRQLEADLAWTVGAGPAQGSLTAGAAGLEEAAQVARTAAELEIRAQPFYRLSDVRLRGLVALLADDSRVRTFAEAELGALLEGRPAWGLDLLDLYLRHGGNKSAVARAGHLSRQSLYARLERLESALGVPLDDPESRTALHVAVLWARLRQSP